MEAGWIKVEQQVSGTGKGGRPIEDIVVHPKFDDFYDADSVASDTKAPEFKSKWLGQLSELTSAKPAATPSDEGIIFDRTAEELFGMKTVSSPSVASESSSEVTPKKMLTGADLFS